MNAATLAGAKGYPPQVLRKLWGMLAVNPPIPFLPPVIRQSWSMFGVPHMYTPRLDWWNMPSWTYFPTIRRSGRRWRISWTGIRSAIRSTCG